MTCSQVDERADSMSRDHANKCREKALPSSQTLRLTLTGDTLANGNTTYGRCFCSCCIHCHFCCYLLGDPVVTICAFFLAMLIPSVIWKEPNGCLNYRCPEMAISSHIHSGAMAARSYVFAPGDAHAFGRCLSLSLHWICGPFSWLNLRQLICSIVSRRNAESRSQA